MAVPAHVVIVAGVVASEGVDAVPGEVLAEFGMAGVVPVRLGVPPSFRTADPYRIFTGKDGIT